LYRYYLKDVSYRKKLVKVSIDYKADSSGFMARKKTIDSLKTELFLSQFRVQKVRYYLNICIKNPSQDKFLKG